MQQVLIEHGSVSYEIMTDRGTDRPTNQPDDQQMDRRGHREVTLPYKKIFGFECITSNRTEIG